MKNNQFKKEIRKIIEEECKTFDFTSIYNDESNNSRMIYIYTLDYMCVGIFRLWLNNEYVHLSFTTDLEKPIISAKDKEINCNYAQFNKIIMTIKGCFEIMNANN